MSGGDDIICPKCGTYISICNQTHYTTYTPITTPIYPFGNFSNSDYRSTPDAQLETAKERRDRISRENNDKLIKARKHGGKMKW